MLHTCKEVSIDTFIQCCCNNEYTGLIKSGNPTASEIQSAWNEILFEYATLIKTENSDHIFRLQKDIGILQCDIIYIDNAVSILRYRYEENIAKELRGLGYKVSNEFEEDVESIYQQSLDRITSKAKTKLFDLEQLHTEYQKINSISSGKKLSEEDFESNVAWLGRFQHYHIDTFTTSIFKFTVIFNNYMADSKMRIKNKIPENDG